MASRQQADIIVIGGGMAGVSAAAALAEGADVLVVEAEPQPGYHSTGRSAAYFAAAYGRPGLRALTVLSEAFLRNPPEGFTDVPLYHARDNMFFARPDQEASLQKLLDEDSALQRIDEAAVRHRVPLFKPGHLAGAAWDRRGGDLDVDAILQGFLRQLRRRGGRLLADCRVTGLHRAGNKWRVEAGEYRFEAPVVINAAGAWADVVAELAGLQRLGIQPLRRTALIIDAPGNADVRGWPNMLDADEDFYFKPETGKILISPADETPSAPCDAQPDDLDVAWGVHHFEQATGLDIRHVAQRWAGLRTFAPDRDLVAGFDPRTDGFFWLAGQGGSGIASAPATASLVAHLIQQSTPRTGFDGVKDLAARVSPARFTG
jgi:D-arginine dehydrogenase